MADMTKRVAFKEGTGPRVVLYHVNDGGHNQTMWVHGGPGPTDELEMVSSVSAYSDNQDMGVGVDISPNTIEFQVNEVSLSTTDNSIWFLCLGTAMPGE